MNRLSALGFVVFLACSAAACLQNFDQFNPGSGQGGSTGATTVSSSNSSSSSSTTSGVGGGSGGSGSGTTSSSSSSGSGGSGGSSSTTTTGSGGPVCGDGTKDPSEACDDGNTVAGDGCSPMCEIEDPDTCPGPTIPLTTAGLTIKGDTTGANNDAGQLPCGGGGSGDFVYQIMAAQDGTLTATLDGNFATHLYARDACPGNNNNLACSMTHMPATITLPVKAGTPVFLFVDGYGGQPEEGPFTLTLGLQ